MDLISIFGVVGAIFFILFAAVEEGTKLSALFAPTAIMIIAGGTTGVTLACYSLSTILEMRSSLKRIIIKPKCSEADLFFAFGELAALARREGLLAIEHHPIKIDIPVLKRGVKLLVDGTAPELLENLLTTELVSEEERLKEQASILATAGGFAPTMGIIGTVLGLVNVLANLENPSDLGPAISVAFLATLYGIGCANILFLPLGKKLTAVSKMDTQLGVMIIEGLISIQSGDNPRVVQEKLLSYIDEKHWEKLRAQQDSAGAPK